MVRGCLSTSCAVVLCVLGATGCGSSAINLKPGEIAKGRGAIFGRVLVSNQGQDITEDCDVLFTGADKPKPAQPTQSSPSGDPSGGRFAGSSGSAGPAVRSEVVSLDETGWIFTTVNTGSIHLKQVSCALGGFGKRPVYTGDDLVISVHGLDRIAYFGDVVVESDLDDDSGSFHTALLFGGVVGGLIASIEANEEAMRKRARVEVKSRFDEALSQYKHRFGSEAGALKPYLSLADGGPFSSGEPPPRVDPLAASAGFAFGKDIGAAQARCSEAGLEWQDLGEGRYGCSGAPLDPGVPVTVKLSACEGKVCEIALDGSADDATWSTLVERFNKLHQKFNAMFGNPVRRQLVPVDGCTEDPKACFDAGRARRSLVWRGAGERTVALSLDGGTSVAAPRLRVVHGTAALPAARPQATAQRP